MATKKGAPAKKAPRAPTTTNRKRGSSTAERRPHTPEAAGSTPAPASTNGARSSERPEVCGATGAAGDVRAVGGSRPPARPPQSSLSAADSDNRPTARLTPLQERFVLEYIKDFNGTRAYKAANAGVADNTAGTEAWRLLKNPEIQSSIAAARDRITGRMELTAERIHLETARLAFFDPRRLFRADGTPKPITELDDDTAAALAGLEVQQIELGDADNPIPATVRKYKVADKNSALERAAKLLALFKDHNKQLADPLAALLGEMKRSTLPVVANPPEGDG